MKLEKCWQYCRIIIYQLKYVYIFGESIYRERIKSSNLMDIRPVPFSNIPKLPLDHDNFPLTLACNQALVLSFSYLHISNYISLVCNIYFTILVYSCHNGKHTSLLNANALVTPPVPTTMTHRHTVETSYCLGNEDLLLDTGGYMELGKKK